MGSISNLFKQQRQEFFQFIGKNFLVMYGTGLVLRHGWLGGKKSKICRAKKYSIGDQRFKEKFNEELETGVFPPLSKEELIEDIEIIREIKRTFKRRFKYWIHQNI